jgi:branched-chain amino acid transport system substrate-binding protein
MKRLARLLAFSAVLLLAATPTLAAEPIRIGALFSVTGPPSFLGEPERNTAQMVVDEINKGGGIKGRPLELVVYDTGGDATKAVQWVNKLIKDDKVVAIIGPSTTGETMAVKSVTEKEQIPLVSCAAGSKITEPVNPWTFKTAQNDGLAVAKIFEHLQRLKLTRVAILTVSDGFGSSGREQLKAQAARYGITLVLDDTYGPKDTDMTAQLTKIRGSDAQAIICWGTNPGPAIIAKNVRQLGITLPLYMSHGVSSKKFIELAGEASEGIILPSGKVIVADVLPAADAQKKALLAYVQGYKQKFGVEGDHFGGHAWDAVMLLKKGIEQGGSTPAAIRDGLEKIAGFAGIGGVFSFSAQDHAGLTREAFVLVQVKNRDWALVE